MFCLARGYNSSGEVDGFIVVTSRERGERERKRSEGAEFRDSGGRGEQQTAGNAPSVMRVLVEWVGRLCDWHRRIRVGCCEIDVMPRERVNFFCGVRGD